MTCMHGHAWQLVTRQRRPFLVCAASGCFTDVFDQPEPTTGEALLIGHSDLLWADMAVNVAIASPDHLTRKVTVESRYVDTPCIVVDGRRRASHHQHQHQWLLRLRPGTSPGLACAVPRCPADASHLDLDVTAMDMTITAIPVFATVHQAYRPRRWWQGGGTRVVKCGIEVTACQQAP